MNLERWIPWHTSRNNVPHLYEPFRAIQRELDRFMENVGRPSLTETMPRLDIKENDQNIMVSAELPGVKEEDVDISLSNNLLTIKGEKKAEKEEKKSNYHLTERSYGNFQRLITLPYDVDPSQINATFNNGILTISIPKPEAVQHKTQKIQIKSESASGKNFQPIGQQQQQQPQQSH